MGERRRAVEQNTQWFETKVCDSSLSAYLKLPESDIIANLAAEQLAQESIRLRRQLETAASTEGSRHQSRHLRITFCNHALDARAGSELWTQDMAAFCLNQGHEVAVYSPTLGPVAATISRRGALVTSSPEAVADFGSDIVHINHYRYAQPVLDAVAGSGVKIVNMIHGVLPRPGMPGTHGVDRYVAVSLAVKSKISLLTQADWADIAIVPNFFDEALFPHGGSRGRRERALLFSSKAEPGQVSVLRETLDAVGYQLDHYGHAGAVVEKPQDMLPSYDLVFAVGRSAIEALASGCKVILWDDGVIGPSIHAENFWSCVTFNLALASKSLPHCFYDEPRAEDWIRTQILAANELNGSTVPAAVRRFLTVKIVGRLLFDIYHDALERLS